MGLFQQSERKGNSLRRKHFLVDCDHTFNGKIPVFLENCRMKTIQQPEKG
jgi:hypothetical protein